MPRAYLRIDPNLDLTQTDPGSFVRLLCAAARQPERGRFRDRALFERVVGRAKARTFLDRCDVTVQPDGRYYVEGWDEWQEGDYTVADRMRRMRQRRSESKSRRDTAMSSHERNDVTTGRSVVTTDAVGTDSLSVVPLGDGDRDEIPPPPAERGRRKEGTNPRAVGGAPRQTGDNPRANGESPRQEREAQKTGPTALREVMAAIAARHGES